MNQTAPTTVTAETLSGPAPLVRTVRRALTCLAVVAGIFLGFGAQGASAITYQTSSYHGGFVTAVPAAREVRVSDNTGVDQGLEMGAVIVSRSNAYAGTQMIYRVITILQWTTNGWMRLRADSVTLASTPPGRNATFNYVDVSLGTGYFYVSETFVWGTDHDRVLGSVVAQHNQIRDYVCQSYACAVGPNWIRL